MKDLLLNDGNLIPQLGFGTYKAKEQEGIEALKYAISKGYRLVDTASIYNNEVAVGKGIIASEIDRKEIFVTSKVWRENLGYQSTKIEFEKTLDRLELEYLDLYLIHWPANAKNYDNWQKTNADTWSAMEELQVDGKIRSIGVSNFFQEHLESLFQTAKVIPAINQIEFHPGYWQPEVVDFCKQHNVTVESWSPLARGKVFGNETLIKISEKYHKSVSQICLRWIIQHEVVLIPKSTNQDRILENMEIFDFELSKSEMNQINSLPEMGFSGELPNIWPDRL